MKERHPEEISNLKEQRNIASGLAALGGVLCVGAGANIAMQRGEPISTGIAYAVGYVSMVTTSAALGNVARISLEIRERSK